MHSLHVSAPEYNEDLNTTLQGLGFVEEVRRREARYRFGKRWDVLHYGILAHEWKERK
jgi:RimJ/RimL family protein N-acetyltransferase